MGDKAYVSTKEVVSYLVDNAPKTVAKGTAFIDTIHEDKYDPNAPLLLSVGVVLRLPPASKLQY